VKKRTYARFQKRRGLLYQEPSGIGLKEGKKTRMAERKDSDKSCMFCVTRKGEAMAFFN